MERFANKGSVLEGRGITKIVEGGYGLEWEEEVVADEEKRWEEKVEQKEV